MATREGARALGLEAEIGQLSPGFRADADRGDAGSSAPGARATTRTAPSSMRRRPATCVLTVVDGEVLAEGGALTRIDRRGLLDEAAIAGPRPGRPKRDLTGGESGAAGASVILSSSTRQVSSANVSMPSAVLSERTRRVLSTLVRDYIDSGEPVASATLTPPGRARCVVGDHPQRPGPARGHGLRQPAPHLGRTGADRPGLPLLRRHAARRPPARPATRSSVEARLREQAGDAPLFDRVLSTASHVLFEVSHHVGFAIAPADEQAIFQRIDFVPLSQARGAGGDGRARRPGDAEGRRHRRADRAERADARPPTTSTASSPAGRWPRCARRCSLAPRRGAHALRPAAGGGAAAGADDARAASAVGDRLHRRRLHARRRRRRRQRVSVATLRTLLRDGRGEAAAGAAARRLHRRPRPGRGHRHRAHRPRPARLQRRGRLLPATARAAAPSASSGRPGCSTPARSTWWTARRVAVARFLRDEN